MKRFYVVPKTVLYQAVPGQNIRHHDLFRSAGGAHYVVLDGVHVLLCCGDFDRQDHEAAWHAHPEVARMHDSRSDKPMGRLLHADHAHKKFKAKHLDALGKIGVKESHTVQDVSGIASKIHPLVSLGEEY